VDLKILNSSGKTVCSVAATPNSKSYDMANADAAMTFSKLSPGAYRYIVSATDTVQTRIFADQQFSVTAPANPPASQSQVSKSSGISITDTRLPEVLYKGKAFSFWGKLDSSKKMKQVRVQVLNRKGKSVLSASSKPNKKLYIVYPNARSLLKYINECEMVFIKPNTDIIIKKSPYAVNLIRLNDKSFYKTISEKFKDGGYKNEK
jgi:hypothetical protein